MRGVAENVEEAIIPDCGHWITEEQPQATTDLVVDFLRRADARSGVSCGGVAA
jgi:pimeloyl-ACP methyl ester carboxylesterase